MNEKDFKILVEIEKSRSITAVAEALYMTQIHSKVHGTILLGVASTFGQYIMPTFH